MEALTTIQLKNQQQYFSLIIKALVGKFNLLIKSHSAARYNNIFNVDVEDANSLFDRVKDFVPLVKKKCKRKIVALELESETSRQHQKERE